jgi:sugar phosphate isomerase/epimerase
MLEMAKWSIGVFTSVDAGLGVDLDVARELGIPTIQIHAPHLGNRNSQTAQKILDRLKPYGIEITAVFGGFEGESYADIPTVVRTVGLVPAATRASRLEEMKEISDFAVGLGCPVIALHLGFVPHDRQSVAYREVIGVTQELCDHARRNGQRLHLETGQETAEALVTFIADCGRDNLYVNFDPANMILYGAGEPIEALKLLGNRVRSVHFKDAKWGSNPGIEWGQEVPLGQGDVGIERYLQTLKDIGYDGPLTIEREIPQEPQRQKSEIGQAVELINRIKASLMD